MTTTWHVLTGEHPPQRGGISDHTASLTAGMVACGARVHVWCPAVEGRVPDDSGVIVHELPTGFDRSGLRGLTAALDRFEAPRRLLVQYAPNAFGMRGANLLFCRWLLGRARAGDDVRVMFHEPFYYFAWQSLRRNLLAATQRLMAAMLLRASRVVYLSHPAWPRFLTPYSPSRRPPMIWLPISATVPTRQDPTAVAALRRTLLTAGGGTAVVGHFGTYAADIVPDLHAVIPELLRRRPELVCLLLGGGGDRFARAVRQRFPELKSKLISPGFLSPDALSLHLQACDLCIQPYPDGVSCRRTSVMGCLVNSVATVTTSGPLTDDPWLSNGAMPLAPAGDPHALVILAESFLSSAERRRAAAEAGRELYYRHFALDHALRILRPLDEPITAAR